MDCWAFRDERLLEDAIGKFRYLFARNGQYCTEKIVCGKRTYLPVKPQPADDDVYTIHRYYATQSDDGKAVYRKCVT